MITVAKLLERTRLFVNDTNKTKYSDYEISSAIVTVNEQEFTNIP